MIEGIVVNTLVRAGVYALLALGFSLIFGVARVLQLSHTAFYMVAAYGIFTFADLLGWDPIWSILASIIITTGLGLLTYKLFIDRVREHHVTVMLITLALAIVFQEIMLIFFTGQYRSAPAFVTGYWEIIGVLVAPTLVLEPHMLWPPFVMVMAIITLGGLGSVKGSIVGAFILALVEVLVVYLLPTGAFLKGAAALLVMVIVLTVRPEGLFGVVFEEERL